MGPYGLIRHFDTKFVLYFQFQCIPTILHGFVQKKSHGFQVTEKFFMSKAFWFLGFKA